MKREIRDIIFTCDRCGKIGSMKGIIDFNEWSDNAIIINCVIGVPMDAKGKDLCTKCQNSFAKWWKEGKTEDLIP